MIINIAIYIATVIIFVIASIMIILGIITIIIMTIMLILGAATPPVTTYLWVHQRPALFS